jgi:hypothetical protein
MMPRFVNSSVGMELTLTQFISVNTPMVKLLARLSYFLLTKMLLPQLEMTLTKSISVPDMLSLSKSPKKSTVTSAREETLTHLVAVVPLVVEEEEAEEAEVAMNPLTTLPSNLQTCISPIT